MQVYFDTNTFTGRPVNTCKANLEHARLLYETRNICRMKALTPEEKQQAFRLIKDKR